MKSLFPVLLLLGVSLTAALADETVRAAQTRLKQDGFYYGDATGSYDSATSAAVTRYQIRHGLAISGRLDPETAKAIGLKAAKTAEAEPSPIDGTWRRLRNGDMQFLKSLHGGEIPPPKPAKHPPAPSAAPAPAAARPTAILNRETPPPPARRAAAEPESTLAKGVERIRDYVAAFVLAGLDPEVGKELEFFARKVDYFGEANSSREKIRRDLERYDRRWPQRRFWLAGELKLSHDANGQLRVTFPLRYELRNGRQHASGKVMKTLVLRQSGGNDLEIAAVNEEKTR